VKRPNLPAGQRRFGAPHVHCRGLTAHLSARSRSGATASSVRQESAAVARTGINGRGRSALGIARSRTALGQSSPIHLPDQPCLTRRGSWQRSISAYTTNWALRTTGHHRLVVIRLAQPRGEFAGIPRIAEALNVIHGRTASSEVRTILETTAGRDRDRPRFEHLAEIISLTEAPSGSHLRRHVPPVRRGPRLTTDDGYGAPLRHLTGIIGLDRLLSFHLNDSKKPLGSHVDRHEPSARLPRPQRFRGCQRPPVSSAGR